MRVIWAVLSVICFFQATMPVRTAEAAQAAATGAMFPDVVARVNGQPISGRELEAVVRRELAEIDNPEWNSLQEQYRSQLTYGGVTSLVNSKLIYEKAVAEGVKVTATEVDEAVQELAKNYASDAEMNAALARQFLNRDTLRQKAEQELTITKYLNSLAQAVTVPAEDVSKYYAEHPNEFSHPDIVRASHILLRGDDNPDLDAQVKAQAEALLAKAKNGGDFAKLAKENSVDATASAGGDIGYVTKNVLDADFANAAFAMNVGDTRLVKSRFGYHVIKLTDKKPEGVATFDEVKDDLTTLLRRDKAQTEVANLIGQLRDQAKVEVLVPYGQ
ncbi:MAG: peptidylprolyl isomerase [Acidobacteriota bacterium]|nr:peptidylprolyl isomerase [Acidobacteriota bacterium]